MNFQTFKSNVTDGPITTNDVKATVAGFFLGGPVGAILSPVVYRGVARNIKAWALAGVVAAAPLSGVTAAMLKGLAGAPAPGTTTSVEAVKPQTVSAEFKGVRFENIRVEVRESLSRSGMNFVIIGDATNETNEEITRADSMALGLGGSLNATFTDDKGREFEGSVSVPALLPGETRNGVVFAYGSAMPGAKTVSFKSGLFGNYFVFNNLPVTYRVS